MQCPAPGSKVRFFRIYNSIEVMVKESQAEGEGLKPKSQNKVLIDYKNLKLK